MKIKELSVIVLFCGILLFLGLGSLFMPDVAVSKSERRPLTQYASYADKAKEAGEKEYDITDYFSFLEQYRLDQFVGRDTFRSVKAVVKLFLLGQKDNQGYYLAEGNLSKMDAVKNDRAIQDAIYRLNACYERFFRPIHGKAYYCVIPDKNYFLAGKHSYLHYDYDAFYDETEQLFHEDMQKIDVRQKLSLDDYYRTDPHWNQTKLLGVAEHILQEMGNAGDFAELTWQTHTLKPFYGTYWGQLGVPVEPESLSYLTCEKLNDVKVYSYVTQSERKLYEEENFNHIDPYDVFLDGAVPLLRIDNPGGAAGSQLVVFRDSFGSSLIPLLATQYREIIVVDIRYLSVESLNQLVHFKPSCDVLFLYSTSVLNSYGSFRN